jgi:hypothetical protein
VSTSISLLKHMVRTKTSANAARALGVLARKGVRGARTVARASADAGEAAARAAGVDPSVGRLAGYGVLGAGTYSTGKKVKRKVDNTLQQHGLVRRGYY